MNAKDAIRLFETQLNIILGPGFEQRKLIGRLNGIKFEIYPNEHVPPHFHLKSPEFEASFLIENCDLLDGYVDYSTHKKVRGFYTNNLDKIIDTWNELHPTDCRVGPISRKK